MMAMNKGLKRSNKMSKYHKVLTWYNGLSVGVLFIQEKNYNQVRHILGTYLNILKKEM
jgi:hypothetical protein